MFWPKQDSTEGNDEVRFVKDQIEASTRETRDEVLTRLLELPWATLDVQKT